MWFYCDRPAAVKNSNINHFFYFQQDFREFTDAEGLVSIPTSDLHHPTICMQFQKYKSISTNSAYPDSIDASTSNAIEPATGFSTITLPLETPLRLASLSNNSNSTNNNNNNNISSNNYNNNNASADLASVDSSDTYASCQTHPFTSAGDLTADFAGISCDLDDLDMNNFASNPFERNGATATTVNNNCGESFIARANVKRSASGDGILHSFGATPTLEMCQAFQSLDSASAIHRGSEASLNDVPVPKHRKTRFQQGSLNKLKARTATSDGLPIASTSSSSSQKKLSHDSLTEAGTSATTFSTLPTTKKNRRASFMPSKSLASATKLINQHLFGIQNNIPKLKGIQIQYFTLQ